MPKLTLAEQSALLAQIQAAKPWKLKKVLPHRSVTKDEQLYSFLENGIRLAECPADDAKVRYCMRHHRLGCKCWRRVFMTVEERAAALKKLLEGHEWKCYPIDKIIAVKQVYAEHGKIIIISRGLCDGPIWCHVIYDSKETYFMLNSNILSGTGATHILRCKYMPCLGSPDITVGFYECSAGSDARPFPLQMSVNPDSGIEDHRDRLYRLGEVVQAQQHFDRYNASCPAPTATIPVTLTIASAVSLPAPSPTPAILEERVEKEEEEETEKESESLCKICMEVDSNTVFIGCGHSCCCLTCAPKMTSCPICRGSNTFIKLFR
jgi:hypothetical protein